MNPLLLALAAGGAFYGSTAAPLQYRALLRYAGLGLAFLALLELLKKRGILGTLAGGIVGEKTAERFAQEGAAGVLATAAFGERETADQGSVLYERDVGEDAGAPTGGVALGSAIPGLVAAIVNPPEDGHAVERFFGEGYDLTVSVTNNGSAYSSEDAEVVILTTEFSPSLIGSSDSAESRTAFPVPALAPGDSVEVTVLAAQFFSNFVLPLQVVARVYVGGRITHSTFFFVRKLI